MFMSKAKGPIAKAFNFIWSRPILKDTVTTTAFTVIGRSVGFLIPFFIAAWYGVGSETDAFFFAYGIIFLLTVTISGAISSVIVPFVAETKVQGKDHGKFIGSLVVASGLGVLLLCLIFMLVGYPLFKLVTGFKGQQLRLAYLLSLETFPLCLLVIWGSLISGTLNAYQAFAHPQLSLGFRSLITLLFIFLLKNPLGIHAIPIGYILGEGARLIILYFILAKNMGIKVNLAIPGREMRSFIKTSSAMIAATTFFNLNFLIDKAMASWIGVTAVSLLEYGNRLFFLPVTFLGEALFLVLLSHWSIRSYSGDFANLRTELKRALKLILLFSLPLAAALILFRYELTQLCYDRGAFPKDRLAEVSQITGMFLLGLTPWLMNGSILRGLIILKDTTKIAKMAAYFTIIKIIVNLIFIYLLGLKGIALSTSTIEIIKVGILWILFNKSLDNYLKTSNEGDAVEACQKMTGQ
jgi:putative peptidoglycan lipid II flippase